MRKRAWRALFIMGIAGSLACVSGADSVRANDDTALRGHGGPVKSIAVAMDGKGALTGSFDYSMIYWQLDESPRKVALRISDHDGAVNGAQFVPGSNQAVTASDDGAVALWDLNTGELVHRFKGHKHKVVSVTVSSDGNWAASAAWDRTVRLWNLKDLTDGPLLEGHGNTVNAVVFSKDDEFVYSAGYNGEIRQWRVETGELIRTVYKHGWGINALAATGHGFHVLFGSLDGTVGMVELASGQLVETLHRFERPVLSLTSIPEHNMAAAGSGDGFIQVWDTVSWKTKFRHQFTEGPVWALAFARDGKGMYFGGLDDHVAYWQMNPDRPFDVAQSETPRRFQKSEGLDPGERQFARKCSICHSLGEDHANRAGPSLIGVFGRKVGTVPGYSYSETLKHADFEWNEETIDRLFAEGPENFVPGTKMPLQKMSQEDERLALIKYLKRATKSAIQQDTSQSGNSGG